MMNTQQNVMGSGSPEISYQSYDSANKSIMNSGSEQIYMDNEKEKLRKFITNEDVPQEENKQFDDQKDFKYFSIYPSFFTSNYKPTPQDLINLAKSKEWLSQKTDSTAGSVFSTPIKIVPKIRIVSSIIPNKPLQLKFDPFLSTERNPNKVGAQYVQQQIFGQNKFQ